jgi:restriction system protein
MSGQPGGSVIQLLWKGAANAGQFIVPVVCLGGAFMSAWRRRQRSKLVSGVTQSESTAALDGMSWREFELLVGEAFRLKGYQVAELGGNGPDGGVDLVLTRPGQNGSEKFVVQCKQWRAYKVGVDVVRELYGVMAARGAAGGFVITSGRVTAEASRFAAGRNVQLIDGPALHDLIRGARSSTSPASTGTAGATVAAAPSNTNSIPSCPLCAKPMKRRTAKRGANAGNDFWGCTDYPDCRGTRPVA